MTPHQTSPSIAEDLGAATGGLWVLTTLLLGAAVLGLGGTLRIVAAGTIVVPWLTFSVTMVSRIVVSPARGGRRLGPAQHRSVQRERPT